MGDMDDMLSSKEIDDLLEFISTGEADTGCDRQKKSVRDYDFRRPDKFSRDQIRTVQMMHEIFARLTAAFLSKKLSVPAGVHVASVDQCTYAEFLRCIPDPATFCRSAAEANVPKAEERSDGAHSP